MRALTGLKQAGMGRPAEMPLNKIHFDPNNSRRPEDENTPEGIEEQRELTRDIKKRGVKSPISLRPHPTIKDEYMVNFGHRRVIGAIQAGLVTIPYFLDVTFDSYDQVKENLLHRKPSVWALAEFVQRKLNEKQSKGEIAEGLGKSNQNLVTELQALVDAPSCLHQAYTIGVKSTRTLYDLRRAYDEFPECVEAWCASGAKITRDTIQEFLAECRQAANQVLATHIAAEKADVGEFGKGPVEAVKVAADDKQPIDDAATARLKVHQEASPQAVRTHQAPGSPELRHDVKKDQASQASRSPLSSTRAPDLTREIMVEYMGKAARVAPDATLMIVVDGQSAPLEVPVADLMFKGTK